MYKLMEKYYITVLFVFSLLVGRFVLTNREILHFCIICILFHRREGVSQPIEKYYITVLFVFHFTGGWMCLN